MLKQKTGQRRTHDGFKKIGDNETVLAELMAKKQNVVPFIGAGFSAPWCLTWEKFLENFLDSLKRQSLLLPDEIKH